MSGLMISDPIKFEDVIRSKNILPGDVLYLRGGTYKGYWELNIGGIDGAPVTIKPYNKEPVIIDGGLTYLKPYVEIYDLEFTDSDPDTTVITKSISMGQPGCWLIGCEIHGLHNSGVNFMGSGIGGVVECWIYENGYYDLEAVGHGHSIYTHNHLGGARLIARNLLNNSLGKYTIHIYSGDNYLRDYTCEDNVIYGDPVHTGGGLGLVNFVYQRNIQFQDYAQMGRYSVQPNDTGLIQDNLFIQLYNYSVQSGWIDLVEQNNTVWDGEPADRLGYTLDKAPASWSKFIPFSLSERWSGIQADLVDGVFSAVMVER